MSNRDPSIDWPPGLRFALATVVAVSVFVGWETFWFFTDDAFILFRYVSNAMRGWGFVWNPPPFDPVEGYTSFLWVALLTLVWKVTGFAPPETANVLSLLFGYLSLFVVYKFLTRMRLPAQLHQRRAALLIVVFLGIITNRTFLTWLSSGLETALFNLLFLWWLYEATMPEERRHPGWAWRLSSSAALTGLARPGGILTACATLVILALVLFRKRSQGALKPAHIGAALPLLAIPTHFVWRFFYYGQWLPNTYYAKHVSAWPESGIRYLASFLLEYGVWLWLIFAAWAGATALWHVVRSRVSWPSLGGLLIRYGPPVIAVSTVLVHTGYYTFIIGGDHFEYRVYSHLIPLVFVSTPWLLSKTRAPCWAVLASMTAFILVSYPIPWTHWAQTHELEKRSKTHVLIEPVADHLPDFLRPVTTQWANGNGGSSFTTFACGARNTKCSTNSRHASSHHDKSAHEPNGSRVIPSRQPRRLECSHGSFPRSRSSISMD